MTLTRHCLCDIRASGLECALSRACSIWCLSRIAARKAKQPVSKGLLHRNNRNTIVQHLRVSDLNVSLWWVTSGAGTVSLRLLLPVQHLLDMHVGRPTARFSRPAPGSGIRGVQACAAGSAIGFCGRGAAGGGKGAGREESSLSVDKQPPVASTQKWVEVEAISAWSPA